MSQIRRKIQLSLNWKNGLKLLYTLNALISYQFFLFSKFFPICFFLWNLFLFLRTFSQGVFLLMFKLIIKSTFELLQKLFYFGLVVLNLFFFLNPISKLLSNKIWSLSASTNQISHVRKQPLLKTVRWEEEKNWKPIHNFLSWEREKKTHLR